MKYYYALIAFLFYSSGFSQFNTLTPMLPKKMEKQKILENTKAVEENNPKQKKDKKSWKQILNLTTKSQNHSSSTLTLAEIEIPRHSR